MATYKPKKKTANGLEDILIPYSCIAGTPTIPTVTSTTVTDGTNTLDISGKQNTLTTSNNITINNNVISALKYYKKADVTGVAGTSTSKVSTTYTVTDNTVTSYYDGMMVTFVLPVAGIGTYGSVFRINSLDYKPIVFNVNSIISTRYAVGSQITMVYNSIQKATAYLSENEASTITGCWQIMDYDATTTDARRVYDYNFRPYVGANKLYRNKLCALDKDNRLNPITITDQTSTTQVAKTPTSVPLKIDNVWLYVSTSNVNAGSVVTSRVLSSQGYYDNYCQYNFNASIPAYRMIYLRGTYDHTTGLFTLYKDSSSPCTSYYTVVPSNTANITLSSYFTSGYYYWLVGATYSSADYLQLFAYNPLYYFDGTNLVNYTKPAIPTVNDGILTIQKNGTNVATFSANQSGNVTANISVPSVENNVTSTSTTNALSANMGKELQTQISNLQNIGRFLAIWDASTGTPTSEPTVSPYTYKVGDYYRVGVAGTKNPATNLTYVIGGTNYVEGGSLSIGDVVYCSNVTSSATTWAKQASMGGGTVQDVQVNGTSVLSGGIANIDISGKANLSGGNTFSGNQIINNDIAYKYTTTYYNCDSNYSSSKCFGLYQWDDKFQYTYRNASNNTYLGTAFEINATNGVTDYKSRPTVNGSGLALLSEIPSTSGYVPTSRTIAGIDLTDNITANELQTALDIKDNLPVTYTKLNGNIPTSGWVEETNWIKDTPITENTPHFVFDSTFVSQIIQQTTIAPITKSSLNYSFSYNGGSSSTYQLNYDGTTIMSGVEFYIYTGTDPLNNDFSVYFSNNGYFDENGVVYSLGYSAIILLDLGSHHTTFTFTVTDSSLSSIYKHTISNNAIKTNSEVKLFINDNYKSKEGVKTDGSITIIRDLVPDNSIDYTMEIAETSTEGLFKIYDIENNAKLGISNTFTGQQIFSNTVDGVTNQLRFHDSKWDIFTCTDTTTPDTKTAIAKEYIWNQEVDSSDPQLLKVTWVRYDSKGIMYGKEDLTGESPTEYYSGTLQFPTNISGTKIIATTSDIPTNTNQLTNGAGFITSSSNITGKSYGVADIGNRNATLGIRWSGSWVTTDGGGIPVYSSSGNLEPMQWATVKTKVGVPTFSLSGTTLTITNT